MFAELRAAAAWRQQASCYAEPPAKAAHGVPQRGGGGGATTGAVLAAMRAHGANAAVQHAVATALWSLACKNDANRSALCSAGAVGLLLAAMRGQPSSADVQASCCAALASLAVDSTAAYEMAGSGAKELVVAALSNHV
eukprot:SAG11_NODE_15674_length_570_cov_0.503185_1_plen_138_part_10